MERDELRHKSRVWLRLDHALAWTRSDYCENTPTNLDSENAVAPAAGIVHCGTPHGAAGHALIDQPLHAVWRGHHHLLGATTKAKRVHQAAVNTITTHAPRENFITLAERVSL